MVVRTISADMLQDAKLKQAPIRVPRDRVSRMRLKG